MAFFSNFFHFECNFFKTYPPTTNCNATFHASWYFFCAFFLILLFGHLGDQCAFRLIVLVSLRLCISFPPLSHHNSVRLPPFRCSCAGPGDMVICHPNYASTPMLDAFDAFYNDHRSFSFLPLWLIPIIVRYRQLGQYFALSKMGGERLSSRVNEELCSR